MPQIVCADSNEHIVSVINRHDPIRHKRSVHKPQARRDKETMEV